MVQSFSTGYYQGTVFSTSNIVTCTCHNSIASNGNISCGHAIGSVDSIILRSIEKQSKRCFFMKSLNKNVQFNLVNATFNERSVNRGLNALISRVKSEFDCGSGS